MKQQKESSSTENETIQKSQKKYSFVQREGEDHTCIKLMDEKYIGVIVKYTRIAFAPEENADGTRQFIFDYEIIFDPGNEDLTTKEFVDHLGDMAVEILDEQLQNGNAVFK